jgi:hypothetical protein
MGGVSGLNCVLLETCIMAAMRYRTPQALDLAYLPFNYLSLYTQMARDFSRYAQAMTSCTDAMEAARAEADFGARLFADLTQGYLELAMAPWTAMASAMAQGAVDAPAAPVRPMKGRGRTH